MKRQFISILLALAVCSTPTACGGDDEAETQATKLQLNGTYRPAEEGPIRSVTFSGDKDYLLVPSGCAGGGCAEIGTYRIDTASRVLVLERASTHETRSIALEIVETTTTNTSRAGSVRPRDLVERGGGELVEGNGELTETVVQLVEVVLRAIMNGQRMTRDSQKEKTEATKDQREEVNDGNPNLLDCTQGIPTKDATPAEVLAYLARCPFGP